MRSSRGVYRRWGVKRGVSVDGLTSVLVSLCTLSLAPSGTALRGTAALHSTTWRRWVRSVQGQEPCYTFSLHPTLVSVIKL